VYDKFGVDENTRSFVGHAVALFTDDKYMDDRPAIKVMERILLYRNSFYNLGGGSPYLYPRHGLSELPQGFARQGAVYGATTMLRAPLQEVLFEHNVAQGVRLTLENGEPHDVRCKYIIGDPSYFPDRVKTTGKVLRMICIMDHPIPNTDNAHSAQVIIAAKDSGRSHGKVPLSSFHRKFGLIQVNSTNF
jgi:Rab GDP dissociation inhibitor